MVFEYIALVSDLAIIFLLFVQSYVLWVLKKPILETARNSEVYKKLFHIGESDSKCISPNDPNHIHTEECFK